MILQNFLVTDTLYIPNALFHTKCFIMNISPSVFFILSHLPNNHTISVYFSERSIIFKNITFFQLCQEIVQHLATLSVFKCRSSVGNCGAVTHVCLPMLETRYYMEECKVSAYQHPSYKTSVRCLGANHLISWGHVKLGLRKGGKDGCFSSPKIVCFYTSIFYFLSQLGGSS